MKRFIRLLIRGYQILLAPILRGLVGGGSCRFEPTCSHYFMEAVQVHGAVRGSALGVSRLCRCQPWGGQGYDPVPPSKADGTGSVGAVRSVTFN